MEKIFNYFTRMLGTGPPALQIQRNGLPLKVGDTPLHLRLRPEEILRMLRPGAREIKSSFVNGASEFLWSGFC